MLRDTDHDEHCIRADLCHRICPYDRDLPDGKPRAHTLCNFWKQRAEHDRAELFKVAVCTGLPGIFNHGVRRDLCGTHSVCSIFIRYRRIFVGSDGIYHPSCIYAL